MWVVSAFDEFIARVSALLQCKIRITAKEIYTYARRKTHTYTPKHKIERKSVHKYILYSCTYDNALI